MDAGITSLSDFAFFGCSALMSVQFAEGSRLTTIGGSVFNGCTSLRELVLPGYVRTIYGNAFRGCSSLEKIYLPDSTAYIAGNTFAGCGQVVLNVAYNSYAKQYAINNSLRYTERGREITAGGSCGSSASWVLYSDGTLSIQGTGALSNPSSAGAVAWAAYRESIRSVDIAAGITNLPDFAFYRCSSLTEVRFADDSQVTTIGGSAFSGCASLRALILPGHVKTVYGNAFRDCANLQTLALPDSLTYMSGNVLRGCNQVVLTVSSGSYAEQWAKTNQIAYTVR